jgi:hypothetical protein
MTLREQIREVISGNEPPELTELKLDRIEAIITASFGTSAMNIQKFRAYHKELYKKISKLDEKYGLNN